MPKHVRITIERKLTLGEAEAIARLALGSAAPDREVRRQALRICSIQDGDNPVS